MAASAADSGDTYRSTTIRSVLYIVGRSELSASMGKQGKRAYRDERGRHGAFEEPF